MYMDTVVRSAYGGIRRYLGFEFNCFGYGILQGKRARNQLFAYSYDYRTAYRRRGDLSVFLAVHEGQRDFKNRWKRTAIG